MRIYIRVSNYQMYVSKKIKFSIKMKRKIIFSWFEIANIEMAMINDGSN